MKNSIFIICAIALLFSCSGKHDKKEISESTNKELTIDVTEEANESTKIALQDYTLGIDGMVCGYCSGKTTRELANLPWIQDLKVSHDENLATFNLASNTEVNETELASIIRNIGFSPKELSLKGKVVTDIGKVNSNTQNTKYVYRVLKPIIRKDASFDKLITDLKKADSKVTGIDNEDYAFAQIYSNKKMVLVDLYETVLDAGFIPIKVSENEGKWILGDDIEKEGLKKYTVSKVTLDGFEHEKDEERIREVTKMIFEPHAYDRLYDGIKLFTKKDVELNFDDIEKQLLTIFPNLSGLQIGDNSKEYKTENEKLEGTISSTFKVGGKCPMCKARIEKVAKTNKNIAKAEWSLEGKELSIWHTKDLNLMELKKAIAKAGHDTDEVIATDEDYNNLPGCCKYRD